LNARDLEQYLHEQIPLAKAMQVRVVAGDSNGVVLWVPLAPNINPHQTAFAGSISAVATLAAWSLLYIRLTSLGLSARLVIKRHTMHYELPISGRFKASASPPDAAAWKTFVRTLAQRGRAKITVSAVLEYRGQIAGRFEGEFVALAETGA
jgi:thioesterase domain-containing protein